MWRAVVLGSAQDGGLPQLGASLDTDQRAGSGEIPRRLSSCVAVVADDGRAVILDAGPDIRGHEEVLAAGHSRGRRAGFVDGIVLTHAHIGHYAGLVQFGREAMAADRLPVWVTPEMGRFLESNAPWSLAIAHEHLELRKVEPGSSVEPWPDLELGFIPVPHRHEASDTVAISVNRSMLYLPDIDGWEQWPDAEKVMEAHRVLFIDATFWSPDELPGRDVAEIKHPLVPDTIDRFGGLTDGRRMVLTHLNHSNPLVDPASPEALLATGAGFGVAIEGMAIDL